MEKQQQATSRRDFLKHAGIATAGALTVDWARSTRYAIAAPRVIGANDRIRVAHIGCGGQGMAHVHRVVNLSRSNQENVEIVGVCDIYEPRKERAARVSGAKVYHDYRQLLDEAKPDAVWITTPEHWHARQACDAMEAGCDVYIEKPMTRYLDEATKVYKTALRTKRVVQVGSQGCAWDIWRKAHELIQAGKIGKVVWSQASYCRNSKGGEWNYGIDEGANPSNLDWNAFLGPAPKVPFSKERYFRWRKYWDYSAGISSDLFPHRLHPLMIAIGPEFPVRVVCTGGIYVHFDRDVPDTTHMVVDYPSGHTIVVAGSTCNERGLEDMIRGNKANMYISGNTLRVVPERTWADEVEEETIQVPGPGDDITAMVRNFLQCVRTREKPYCDLELAYRVMVTLALAEISYRENRVVGFDPEKHEVVRGSIPQVKPPAAAAASG